MTEGIRLTPQYGGKNTRAARTVLFAMMYPREREEAAPQGQLTVEHIMPQTLSQDWRAYLGDRADEIHRRHLHRLGNLTLCGRKWGSTYSNRVFEEKKPLYKKSLIPMTMRLAELPEWDEDAIRRRAEELAQNALRLWPWITGER